MNKSLLESTLSLFLKAWENKDIEAVVDLLADSFEYYETPLEEPLITVSQIRKLWSPVPQFEADIYLTFKTMCVQKNFGLFRITGKYKHTYDKKRKVTEIDRIFLLAINELGKITKFMQWRESVDK